MISARAAEYVEEKDLGFDCRRGTPVEYNLLDIDKDEDDEYAEDNKEDEDDKKC